MQLKMYVIFALKVKPFLAYRMTSKPTVLEKKKTFLEPSRSQKLLSWALAHHTVRRLMNSYISIIAPRL